MSRKSKEGINEDKFKSTGGLDLDSPTTKQAMLRLGIVKDEIQIPVRSDITYKGKDQKILFLIKYSIS